MLTRQDSLAMKFPVLCMRIFGTTAACHWRENGINIVEIKELMGHASLTSTMVYQDVTDKQKREAIRSLENNVTQTMKKKWTMPDNRSLAAMFGIKVD